MASSFKRTIRQVREADPGGRFRLANSVTRADRRTTRIALVTLGILLMVAAAATFWVPGPNFVLVLAGLALIAGQSLRVATALDHGEVRARRWKRDRWDPWPHKRALFGVVALVLAAGVAGAGWFAWERFG